MWYLKACPRCGGDLNDGPYDKIKVCLQCGYRKYEDKPMLGKVGMGKRRNRIGMKVVVD